MEQPIKGIIIGDAFEKLNEGVPNTFPTQLQQFRDVIDREVF
jgi:hypothetical protein